MIQLPSSISSEIDLTEPVPWMNEHVKWEKVENLNMGINDMRIP